MKHSVVSQQIVCSTLTVLLTCSMLMAAFAGSPQQRDQSRGTVNVKVSNFGQINDHIYRGAQPKGNDYHQLAAIGVKTIVDLRGDAERGSRSAAESAGLRYINLPLADKQYPQA